MSNRIKQLLTLLLGFLIILAAVPIGFISEVAVGGGCCGAPSNGQEGNGIIVGGLVVVVGIIVMIQSKRFSGKN